MTAVSEPFTFTIIKNQFIKTEYVPVNSGKDSLEDIYIIFFTLTKARAETVDGWS